MKFLVIRFSSIGDIVLTTAAIRCLKQQVPDADQLIGPDNALPTPDWALTRLRQAWREGAAVEMRRGPSWELAGRHFAGASSPRLNKAR